MENHNGYRNGGLVVVWCSPFESVLHFHCTPPKLNDCHNFLNQKTLKFYFIQNFHKHKQKIKKNSLNWPRIFFDFILLKSNGPNSISKDALWDEDCP